jgi:Phosphotransferase enzyme family
MTVLRTGPGTDELRIAIERALFERFGTRRRVAAITRRPSEYRTTSPIYDLTIALDDGERLSLVLKDLSRGALSPGTRRVKPRFLREPVREIETYRTLLAPAGIGALFYGAVIDRRLGRFWLLLEKVNGIELYQVGELDVWRVVARWLARFHEGFRERGRSVAAEAKLLWYDAAFYRTWLERAVAFAREAGLRKRTLEQVAQEYDEVVERLVALTPTVIHGEFYPSNVLVAGELPTLRVVPVDWEMTGLAPGLVDLAALTSGWPGRERRLLSDAYRHELSRLGSAADEDGFAEDLACCRLHVALQWLGWSPSWTPPPQHRQDWLQEAISALNDLRARR